MYQSGVCSNTLVVMESSRKNITMIVSKISKCVSISSKEVLRMESFRKMCREMRLPMIPMQPTTLRIMPSIQNLRKKSFL